MTPPLLSSRIARERDVVLVRQRARQLARLVGFDLQDSTRIATAVSEIARNAYAYADGGKVEFGVEGQTRPQILVIRIIDHGPGIDNVQAILDGRYRSETGMGLGIVGSRRLVDGFEIDSVPGRGTTVTLRKIMPRRAPLITPATVPKLMDALAEQVATDPLGEVQAQNQELLGILDELRRRQDELLSVNAELEDTNRGVVALYAELEERADHLRRADDLKSRFLSNMSHEFRTPLNSILALTRLLLDRADGPLTEEQVTQIDFVRKAAEDLSNLVNDLLDLAKVEAGKIVIRPIEFEVDRLFGALRGMLRPLLVNASVSLIFEDPADISPIQSDESKVSQILRNFISNALKFTEKGEIRVRAEVTPDGRFVAFSVADTGIGIAPDDQERIFQEFTQLENSLQRRVTGTGLGLPLSRKLAELLGGTITVVSTPGVGSMFSLTIPVVYMPAAPLAAASRMALDKSVEWQPDPARLPVLVVEDAPDDLLVYQTLLRSTVFQAVPARTLMEARQVLRLIRPRLVILDILLRGEDTWTFLSDLKREPSTRAIPVVVITDVHDRQKATVLGADAYANKPVDGRWLLDTLTRLAGTHEKRILIIDDDDVARYLLRGLLRDLPYRISEARGGREGLEMARAQSPDLIFCDMLMPDTHGLEVVRALREDPLTRNIPVIMNTVKSLSPEETRQLETCAVAVFSKQVFARAEAVEEVRRVLARAGVMT